MDHTDERNPGLRVGDELSGYRIQRIEEISEFGFYFYELEHLTTGARHIHLSAEDRENTFAVTFKTVPRDSTGVAHILEHTVLCGSKRYPVRDPFFSMIKRSLSTFMNAFTASDWTMYPYSTQNRKDYYNLMDVYLDSAFFPKIDLLSFKQEGHRLEFADGTSRDASSDLLFKGVVYNEMKGAMSSADQVMARSLLAALFPDTTYRFNSGGDPAAIPELTYEQLREFHRHHYHPSNSYFYTYGNLPLETHLDYIQDKVLKHYERLVPDTDVSAQPRWKEPRQVTARYPLAEGEDAARKSQACVAWLTADIRDSFHVLVMVVLEQILLGNPGSPLRKALIDSGLGSALCDSAGYDADYRDTLFVAGLKGTATDAAESVESLVLEVLETLARQGIDPQRIESALHQIEFHYKEVTNTPYPYGLRKKLTVVGPWIHGGDPLNKLRLDDDLNRLRQALSRSGFLEDCIRRQFVENPHRVRFSLVPDVSLEKERRRREKETLARIARNLDTRALEEISTDAKALALLQQSEEDLSVLPTLKRKDIPPDIVGVSETEELDDCAAVTYEQGTSGIFYYSAAAGAGDLDPRLVPLVPFFCFAATRVGTAERDYTEVAHRIDRYTGGVGFAANARTGFDSAGSCIPFVTLNAKCLERNLEKTFQIVEELMFTADFSDGVRLQSLLQEYRANLESMVVHHGHRLAMSLAARNFSVARRLHEIWSGVFQLQTAKKLSEHTTAAELKALAEDLAAVRRSLFVRNNLKTALIGEASAMGTAHEKTRGIYGRLKEGGDGFHPPAIALENETPAEGWSTSSAVSFVAQAFPAVRMVHEHAAALAVVGKLLRSLYLHREIREKGGAYGGFSLYSPEDGIFWMASYRDPHIIATLNAYTGAADFIVRGNYSDQDIDEAVLQVCSEIDRPDPPGPKARKAFYRRLISLSDGDRRRFKRRLLELNRPQVMEAAGHYFRGGLQSSRVAVVSGEEQLLEANAKLAQPLSLHKI